MRLRPRFAMMSLSDLQQRVRDAVITDDIAQSYHFAPLLIGGSDPSARLAIHRRHYEASLVTALLDKFPAVTWLVGALFVREAARAFAHLRPPAAPCIAEYGADFPAFLATHPGAERVACLSAFAGLEWCVGQSAIVI